METFYRENKDFEIYARGDHTGFFITTENASVDEVRDTKEFKGIYLEIKNYFNRLNKEMKEEYEKKIQELLNEYRNLSKDDRDCERKNYKEDYHNLKLYLENDFYYFHEHADTDKKFNQIRIDFKEDDSFN